MKKGIVQSIAILAVLVFLFPASAVHVEENYAGPEYDNEEICEDPECGYEEPDFEKCYTYLKKYKEF